MIPRLVLGAPHGQSGKTTVAVGLAGALAARGLSVQTFKKGPDYIDPSWLALASGRPCRNLDLFLMPGRTVRESFTRASLGADLALVEGAMGLYDGVDDRGTGSTARLARLLEAPVILVVSCRRATRTVAAVVKGMQCFDRHLRLAGVILNHVATARQERLVARAIDTHCGLQVLGALPPASGLALPSRHLGLVPPGEDEALRESLASVVANVAERVDLDAVLAVARRAPSPSWWGTAVAEPDTARARKSSASPRVRIGVLRDRAFSFYYPENLEALREAGAELVPVDSLRDPGLPPLGGLYIGGGFPEVFAAELAANEALRRSIAGAVERGLAVYAECAGLIYLCRSIQVGRGQLAVRYPMVGVFPIDVEVGERPQGHGYMVVEVSAKNPYFRPGGLLKGHEFHYSRLMGFDPAAYRSVLAVRRGHGIDGRVDGLTHKGVLATFMHLHAGAAGAWARAFVRAAADRRERMAASPLEDLLCS